jgi:hypothetical protein
MFGIWAMVALICTLPAKLLALFMDRDLSWRGAWRLGSVALLPGACLVAASTFLYGWQIVDLVGLAFLWVAHLVVSCAYLFGGVWACPRLSSRPLKQNPFIS